MTIHRAVLVTVATTAVVVVAAAAAHVDRMKSLSGLK
jgi:hypothetical protein